MNLKFSGAGIAFLRHYQAETDIRYYLHGVYLRPLPAEAGGGVLGAAMNGHILGMWHDKEGAIDRPAIVTITKKLWSACARPLRGVPTQLVLLDGRLTCVCGNEEVYIQPNPYVDPAKPLKDREPWEVAGKFPEINRVVPSPKAATDGSAAYIRAQYLGLLANSLPNKKSSFHGITLRQAHTHGGTLAMFSDIPHAAAVLMGMSGTPEGAGAWLQHLSESHVPVTVADQLAGKPQ